MKRYVTWCLLMPILLLTSCGKPVMLSSAAEQSSSQMDKLQVENQELKQQVETLHRKYDQLQRELAAAPVVGQIKVSYEQAEAIARGDANGWQTSHRGLVEFMLREPDRWVAVWYLENGDCPRCSKMVIDALTGKVLNATSGPTGQ